MTSVILMIAATAMALLTGVGMVVVLGTMTETAIAGSYRGSAEAFHAAEAAAEFALSELAARSDWEDILSGSTTSALIDGPSGGVRRVGATTLDLTEATGMVNAIGAPPDGAAPAYGLYAHGRFADLLPPAEMQSPMYVVVWIADLATRLEGEEPASPIVGIVGRAYGPTGSSRSVAISVTRTSGFGEGNPGPIRVLSWAELR